MRSASRPSGPIWARRSRAYSANVLAISTPQFECMGKNPYQQQHSALPLGCARLGCPPGPEPLLGLLDLPVLPTWTVVSTLVVAMEEKDDLSLIHISEPTRRTPISYAVFCL